MNNLDNRILSIFTLILNKDSHGNQDILNLYKIVDNMEIFMKILGRFSGRTIKFPTIKEVEEALTTALIYYYKEQGMSWKEIQAIMPVEFSPTGYSMKIKSLNSFILKSLSDVMKKEGKNE